MDRTAWTIECEYMGVLELHPVWECSFRAVLPNSNPAENNCTLVTYLILACKAGHRVHLTAFHLYTAEMSWLM